MEKDMSSSLSSLEFQIYPNPTMDKFKACLPPWQAQNSVLKDEHTTIEIYDMNGRKLIEKNIPKGRNAVEIDVSMLNNGIYCCLLSIKNKTLTKKLIITKHY